jgi:hypothetical protein
MTENVFKLQNGNGKIIGDGASPNQRKLRRTKAERAMTYVLANNNETTTIMESQ